MPEFELNGARGTQWKALDGFTQGYIEAMFFTDTGPEEGQLGDTGFADLAPEALADIIADCTAFQESNSAMLRVAYEANYNDVQAGRDFWFTRCGHGVGYWDRNELDGRPCQQELTRAAKRAGEVWTTLGDDGKVYHG